MVDICEYSLEIHEVDKETVSKVKKYFNGLSKLLLQIIRLPLPKLFGFVS